MKQITCAPNPSMLNMLTTKPTCPCMLQLHSGADPRFFAWVSTHDVNFRQKPMKFLIRLGHPLISGNGFSFKTTLDWNDLLVRHKFAKWKKWIVICIICISCTTKLIMCATRLGCVSLADIWSGVRPNPPHIFFSTYSIFGNWQKNLSSKSYVLTLLKSLTSGYVRPLGKVLPYST